MDLLTVKQKDIKVAAGVLRQIKQEAEHEAKKGGFEAVGLLASRPDEDMISCVVPMRNHSSQPKDSFFVEPWDQFRAEKLIEEEGLVIRGVWHSHPLTDAVPSGADEKLFRKGQLMVIHSVRAEETHVYEEKPDGSDIVMARIVPVGQVEEAA